MIRRWGVGLLATACLLGTVVLANWLMHFGLVPVGFGLYAPAGVYAAALALVFRDVTQNTMGKWVAMFAIIGGALVSLEVATNFAVASAIAFLASETTDFLVFTPLARHGWVRSALPAGLAGIVVDSLVFLGLAFHSEALLPGQIVGKLWAILAAVTALAVLPIRRYYVCTST